MNLFLKGDGNYIFISCIVHFLDGNQQAIGAISCMIRRPSDGKLIGYNVDYLGAIGAIEEALRGVANLSYKLLNVLCFLSKYFLFNYLYPLNQAQIQQAIHPNHP